MYPDDLTDTELTVVKNACGTSNGTWNDAGTCPADHDASCEDYASGTITASDYYYGVTGQGEDFCVGAGGTWWDNFPDYAGSCWPSDYECQAWEASWDTPDSVMAACGGTYSADECPQADVIGVCEVTVASRTMYYYTGHSNIAGVEYACTVSGGSWSVP